MPMAVLRAAVDSVLFLPATRSAASQLSKQMLIEAYEYKVKKDSPIWEQELNDPAYDDEQKANVRASRDRAVGTLRVLKKLP